MISDECCICFEPISDRPIYLKCNKINDHFMCKKCYLNYIKYSINCPICRLPIKNLIMYDLFISIFNYNKLNKLLFFMLDVVGYSVGLFIMGVFVKHICWSLFDVSILDKL